MSEKGELKEPEVRCLNCGYDLQGHMSAMCRCPECGYATPKAMARVTREAFEAQLRRLETPATFCIASMWIAMGGWGLGSISGHRVGYVLIGVAAPVWFFAGLLYGRKSDFRPGWIATLGWFHLAGLVWAALFTGVGAVAWIGDDLLEPRAKFVMYTVVVLLGFWGPFVRRVREHLPPNAVYRIAQAKHAAYCRRIAAEQAQKEINAIGHGGGTFESRSG